MNSDNNEENDEMNTSTDKIKILNDIDDGEIERLSNRFLTLFTTHLACSQCNGYYGPSYQQPVCLTCHTFLFSSSIPSQSSVPGVHSAYSINNSLLVPVNQAVSVEVSQVVLPEVLAAEVKDMNADEDIDLVFDDEEEFVEIEPNDGLPKSKYSPTHLSPSDRLSEPGASSLSAAMVMNISDNNENCNMKESSVCNRFNICSNGAENSCQNVPVHENVEENVEQREENDDNDGEILDEDGDNAPNDSGEASDTDSGNEDLHDESNRDCNSSSSQQQRSTVNTNPTDHHELMSCSGTNGVLCSLTPTQVATDVQSSHRQVDTRGSCSDYGDRLTDASGELQNIESRQDHIIDIKHLEDYYDGRVRIETSFEYFRRHDVELDLEAWRQSEAGFGRFMTNSSIHNSVDSININMKVFCDERVTVDKSEIQSEATCRDGGMNDKRPSKSPEISIEGMPSTSPVFDSSTTIPNDSSLRVIESHNLDAVESTPSSSDKEAVIPLSTQQHHNHLSYMASFPEELLSLIFTNLDDLTLYVASCVCLRWNLMIESSAKIIKIHNWKHMIQCRWPLHIHKEEGKQELLDQHCTKNWFSVYKKLVQTCVCLTCLFEMGRHTSSLGLSSLTRTAEDEHQASNTSRIAERSCDDGEEDMSTNIISDHEQNESMSSLLVIDESSSTSSTLLDKRLCHDRKALLNDPPEGISARPLDFNKYHWQGCVVGPKGSPYEGGSFYLYMVIPATYPFHPPEVRFLTRIFHPNISRHGDIGIDSILSHNWVSGLTLSKVLISIQSLLTDPNCSVCMESDVGVLYRENREAFEAIARQWTWRFAVIDVF